MFLPKDSLFLCSSSLMLPDQSGVGVGALEEDLEHEEGKHVDTDLGVVEVGGDLLLCLGEEDLPLYLLVPVLGTVLPRMLEPHGGNIATQLLHLQCDWSIQSCYLLLVNTVM